MQRTKVVAVVESFSSASPTRYQNGIETRRRYTKRDKGIDRVGFLSDVGRFGGTRTRGRICCRVGKRRWGSRILAASSPSWRWQMNVIVNTAGYYYHIQTFENAENSIEPAPERVARTFTFHTWHLIFLLNSFSFIKFEKFLN